MQDRIEVDSGTLDSGQNPQGKKDLSVQAYKVGLATHVE